MDYNELESRIDRIGALNFSKIFDASTEMYKKVWVQGLIFSVLIMVVLVPVIMAIYIPMMQAVMEQTQNGNVDPDDINNLILQQSGNYRYYILLITFVVGIFSVFLTSGLYRVLKQMDEGKEFNFSNFFYYFKGRYLGKVLTIASFSLLVAALTQFSDLVLPEIPALIFTIALSVVTSVYTVCLGFLFAFNAELSVSEIFSLSFKLGTKKWSFIFILYVVGALVSMLGIIACCIGIIATLAFTYVVFYQFYKTAIGFEDASEIQKIGTE